jgi:hypothetical protein
LMLLIISTSATNRIIAYGDLLVATAPSCPRSKPDAGP